ncbi:MAG: DUF4129 domain-containing protein [Elusimicrobia bacterium]|nr:DUF4129 domain-containing protein [Elusimicrobiota bacterium]
MTTPLGLLGASLLFWGHETGLQALSACLAVALEGSRLITRRWNISIDDFNRLTDAATLFLAGLVIYAYATRPMAQAAMALASWIPLALAPILLAQLLSTKGTFNFSALFWTLRRAAQRGESFAEVRLEWPFFLVTLLSASAANLRTPAFYAGVVGLTGWALLSARRRLAQQAGAAVFVLTSAVLGLAGQDGLHQLQGVLEKKGAELLFGIVEVGADPYQTRTAIGSVGSLLQSDMILARVRPEGGGMPPGLLRRAVYGLYRGGTWHAADARMQDLGVGPDLSTWDLAPEPRAASRTVAVAFNLTRGKGLLALPPGAFRVQGLLAGRLSQARSGTVSVDDGPGLVSYRTAYAESLMDEPAPGVTDRLVPPDERGLMAGLVAELGLDSRKPGRSLAKVSEFFSKGFTYSTYQEGDRTATRPLERFLLKTRSGHCEYFATATALLLRQAGIPSRYCVGWSVTEHSDLEKAFVVRQRHSHAWVLVYQDGRWRDFDTTPATWSEIEAKGSAWWSPVQDLWSWLRFQVSSWRWSPKGDAERNPLFWLALFSLLSWAGWKVFKLKAKAHDGRPGSKSQALLLGLDSEFYAIETALASKGWGRRPSETWKSWLRRLESEGKFPGQELAALADLHERYRFDPAGINAQERKALRQQCLALRL